LVVNSLSIPGTKLSSKEKKMDIIEVQRATVAEHIRQENNHNWPAVYDTFIQDDSAFYDVVPIHTHFAGIGGVKNFYTAADNAFPDFRIDVWGEYDTPGCSIREVTISGTHQGDWCGVAATGKKVKFHLAGLFCLERESRLASCWQNVSTSTI
jgi:predicted ester cyclase